MSQVVLVSRGGSATRSRSAVSDFASESNGVCRSQVFDNTLLGICVSRRNAVSAGKEGKDPTVNRRLARDRREIGKVMDGNRERATRRDRFSLPRSSGIAICRIVLDAASAVIHDVIGNTIE